jgi:pyruvate dehydrogenase phosphatase
MVGNNQPLRPPPASFKTPPYVTALPVVTHRKLDIPLLDPSTQTPSQSKNGLRFLVLATDGLWDELSSEEVVSLVGGHLSGLKGIIPRNTLPTLVPTSTGSQTVEGKVKKDDKTGSVSGSWAFVDDNVSTHLIRNAFGGGDQSRLRRLLSMPAPLSRRYRDDVTVTVVWWEDGREDAAKITSITPQTPKAKL